MDEFEQRKRRVLQPIFFEAGAALFECQSFEYRIAYLLYLFSRMGAKGLNTDNAIAILEDEEKKTAGQLIGMLTKYLDVSEGIEQSFTEALKARNILIHRYLVENIERMVELEERPKIEEEIKSLRLKVRKSHKQLEPFVAALARHLDNIDIDAVAEELKRKFMSDMGLY